MGYSCCLLNSKIRASYESFASYLPNWYCTACYSTGNNRQICFGSEQDFFAYVGWLKEFSVLCKVDIHAWVLMTNHVHLFCTAHEQVSLVEASAPIFY
ncbi:MAG: REP element-mobilizing transposase RayT, partial [Colwellia sp.]